MSTANWQVYDSEYRYGSISRLFHWAMAAVIAWQFSSALAHWLLDDTAVEQFLWRTHKTVGLILLILIALRALWSLINKGRRPPSLNIWAKLGHLGMYLLMIVVPVIALLRQYGSGRAFEPLGIPLMRGLEGQKIEWMMAPANLLHGWLGWLLLVMILGHITMVFVHRRRPSDEDVLKRMLGNR